MLCLEPLQFSILDWLCGGQASCAGQTSEAAHRGLHSNYYSGHSCSEQVASLPALVAPKPPPPSSGLPCKLQSQQLHRTPQPVVFFLWTHRKCHLLLRKIIAFGWI